MDDENETLRGNLHAIEYLLGQIFVMQVNQFQDPQTWVQTNYNHVSDLLERREDEGAMTADAAEAARGTIRRVMSVAATSMETSGLGPAKI